MLKPSLVDVVRPSCGLAKPPLPSAARMVKLCVA